MRENYKLYVNIFFIVKIVVLLSEFLRALLSQEIVIEKF